MAPKATVCLDFAVGEAVRLLLELLQRSLHDEALTERAAGVEAPQGRNGLVV
jgi:hypothetical protein